MSIYEDSRTVSRADLAAWLRQLADQLEAGGRIFYGAGGMVTVADRVHCELEIEPEDDNRISVEIEFSWVTEGEGEKEEQEEPEEPEGAGDTTADESPSPQA